MQTEVYPHSRVACFPVNINLYVQGEVTRLGSQTGFVGRSFKRDAGKRHGASCLRRVSAAPAEFKDSSLLRDVFLPQSPSPMHRLSSAGQVRDGMRLPLVEKVPQRLRALRRGYCVDWRASQTLPRWPLGRFDNTPRLRLPR